MKPSPSNLRVLSWSLITAALAFYVSLLFAGGPVQVGFPGSRSFSVWEQQSFPLQLRVDMGNLGTVNNAVVADLVLEAGNEWGVNGETEQEISTVRFAQGPAFPSDLTGENFDGSVQAFDRELRRISDGQVLVVLDSDGSILEKLLGDMAAENVLGVATGLTRIAPSAQNPAPPLLKGFAILNGRDSFPQQTFLSQLRRTTTHELGHLLGLDHTQVGIELGFLFRPVMFPFLASIAPDRPIRDDIAWISRLYPTANSEQTTGKITGQVFRDRIGGSAMQGAHVVAVMVNSDGSESKAERVSVVSDFLLSNDGSFELPGLQPGNYRLFIEPIAEVIVEAGEGSGVGPFPATAVFRAFPRDYYNGMNESGDGSDNPLEKVDIHVQRGGVTVSPINMVTNELVNQLSLLGDDDQMRFVFDEAFRFPFFGVNYSEVFVNSDGTLTFGVGDGLVGEARTVQRVIDGPPRIAPLFTDLDPSAVDAEIRAETGDGFIKFIWDNVPEFDGDLDPQRNFFSVSLYSNGDILFDFEQVNVTPDQDDTFPEGLQAIVGVAPGGVSGASQDLSAGNFKHKIGNSPIFQVFPGSSFNLTGQRVFFQASQQRLIFPFFRSDRTKFTSFAVNNLSDQAVAVTFELFGADGNPIDLPQNPSVQSIGPNAQLAMTGREIFAFEPQEEVLGWVRVSSDSTAELAGFFQFGNGFGGTELTQLDGSVAFKQPSQKLFFSRILHGPAGFFSFGEGFNIRATTFLSVANPNEEPIELLLTLHNAEGQSVVPAVSRPLSPNGSFFESLNSIFEALPSDDNRRDGFVGVEVDGPGAVGFELIELPDSLLGLNAQTGNGENQLFSAQLGEGINLFTDLNQVNTTAALRATRPTAFLERDSGTIEEKPAQNQFHNLTLGANESISARTFGIFGFTQQDVKLTTGSILIEIDGGPGVIGDVIFGDPANADFVASLPLETQPFRRAVFSQIADGPRNLPPSLQSFTGLAIFNPNAVPADVDIQVFDKDGNLVGETQVTLASRGRLARQVIELIPEAVNLVGGSIFLDSTQPIVAQEIFGNLTFKFQSSVPPTILD